jgi:hypothetical protein
VRVNRLVSITCEENKREGYYATVWKDWLCKVFNIASASSAGVPNTCTIHSDLQKYHCLSLLY